MAEDLTGRRVLCSIRWLLHMLMHLQLFIAEWLGGRLAVDWWVELATGVAALVHVDKVWG